MVNTERGQSENIMTENTDNMVQIPSQGWYNLVVFDADPLTLKSSLEMAREEDEEAILETVSIGLSFIRDRYAEESYSNEDDNLPTLSELQRNERALRSVRNNILSARQ